MTIEVTSLINVVQTIDGRPIEPYAVQRRAVVTPAIIEAASAQHRTIYYTSLGSDSIDPTHQQVLTPVEVSVLASNGTPVPANILLVDPTTDQIYGQSDGAGGYEPLGGEGGGPITSSQITDSTAIGRSVLTASTQVGARTAIGAGTSNLAIGVTGTTACAGNDARLSDARPPTAHNHDAATVTTGVFATARLGSGTANAQKVLAGDSSWVDMPIAGPAYLGTVADETAMLALTAAVGDTAYRTDVSAEFRCIALPASSAASWRLVADLDAVGLTGTGTVSAPALVISTGLSNTVAAAMEALSAALPRDGQYTDVRVAEQGVIELGNGAWTLEKTLNLDLSGASTSRFGLTIRGQGRASTILKTAATAPVANFRGGDGIWRLLWFTNALSSNNQYLRLEGISFVSYCTQGADGSTPLSDPARWVDLKYCLHSALRDLRVYHRYPTALSLDQYGVSLESCYYAELTNVLSGNFNAAGTKANSAGVLKARKGGVAFRFFNNNAIIGYGLRGLGCNLAFHLINEDGLTLHGAMIEDANKGFLFDGDSSGCSVYGTRHETNLTNLAMEAASEMYFARFGETTQNNYVEQFLPGMSPGGMKQDYSASQSNVVFVPRQIDRRSGLNLLSGATWTNSSGITTAGSPDAPTHLDPSVTVGVRVTSTGTYSQVRYSTAVAVNPDLGSVRFRAFVRRVSGAGFFGVRLQSVGGGVNAPVIGSAPYDPVRMWTSANASVPVTSVTWAAGKLTVVCAREHGLQAGMRVQNSATWGSLASATNLYIESTTDASTVVLIAAAGGSISDTGAVSSPANMTVPTDMIPWSFCSDITADWQEFAANVSIRKYVASAPSLDGSNKPIIPFGTNGLGLQTGSKIKLSGFADSRLNGLTYTVLSGDISGSNLTLSGASAMPGLVTTATSKGQAVTSYGYIGLTEVVAEIRCLTTNTGQDIVWDIAGETLTPGYSDQM